MIRLRSAREEEIVREAAENPRDASVALRVYADGGRGYEDLTPHLSDARWGQDAVPIALDATFAANLPDRFDGADFRAFVEVEGVRVPQVPPGRSGLVPGASYGQTDVLASSPGVYFGGEDAIKLGEKTDYLGLAPETIAFDAVRRLPYDPGRVSIAMLGGPLLTYSGSGEQPGFEAEEPVGGVLSRLEESVGYVFRDTAYRGVRADVPAPLSAKEPAPREYHARDVPGWRHPARPAARFYDVRVFRRLPDGTPAYEYRERVPNSRARPGQTLDVFVDDGGGASGEEGRRRALREALSLGRAPRTGSLTLPGFDALTETGDRFAVHARREDLYGAVYEVSYACRVDAYDHSHSLSTTVGYSALVAREERIAVPSLIVPRRSPSALRTA